jgi:hypothetical protein
MDAAEIVTTITKFKTMSDLKNVFVRMGAKDPMELMDQLESRVSSQMNLNKLKLRARASGKLTTAK